jgi:hypothetical protein
MWAQESWLACIKFLGSISQIRGYNHSRQKNFYVSFCKHPRGSKYILEIEKINKESFHFAAHIEEEKLFVVGYNVVIWFITMKFYSNIFFEDIFTF